MKTFKYLLCTFVAMAVGLASCSDDVEYTPGAVPSGQEVFFSATSSPNYEVELNATSVKVPVMRIQSEGAYTANITVDTRYSNIFNIPSTVTFADGQKTADLVITFKFDNLEIDMPYEIALLLNDTENTTPYGLSELKMTVSYPAPWTSLGKAKFTDAMVFDVFYEGIAKPVEIEIQESDLTPGLYRLKNIYKAGSVFYETNPVTSMLTPSTEDTYLQINATDPNDVYFPLQELGFNIAGYGNVQIATLKDGEGQLKNGVFTFPESGFALGKDGTMNYYANQSGQFRVVLPGFSDIPDPEIAVNYLGVYTDPRGTVSAILDFTTNETATYYKWAVVEGNISKDATAVANVIAGIIDGSIKSKEETKAGQKLYAPEADGDYTAVVVPFNSKDEAGAGAFKAFTFAKTSDGPVLPKVGNYTIRIDAKEPYDCPVTLQATDDPKVYWITNMYEIPWLGVIANYNAEDNTLVINKAIALDDLTTFNFLQIFISFNDGELLGALGSGRDGKQPCVITLSANGTPNEFLSDLSLHVFDPETKEHLGWMEQIAPGTTFKEASRSSVRSARTPKQVMRVPEMRFVSLK